MELVFGQRYNVHVPFPWQRTLFSRFLDRSLAFDLQKALGPLHARLQHQFCVWPQSRKMLHGALPVSCTPGTHSKPGLCVSLPKSPRTDALGPQTPLFPHTRSPTAEFSPSSTQIGLEEHLKCNDTGSLVCVFPGCFGISGKKKKSLGKKLEQLLCIRTGWKKLFYWCQLC